LLPTCLVTHAANFLSNQPEENRNRTKRTFWYCVTPRDFKTSPHSHIVRRLRPGRADQAREERQRPKTIAGENIRLLRPQATSKKSDRFTRHLHAPSICKDEIRRSASLHRAAARSTSRAIDTQDIPRFGTIKISNRLATENRKSDKDPFLQGGRRCGELER
jgi:hypothetical protein